MDEYLHIWNKFYGTGKFIENKQLKNRHLKLYNTVRIDKTTRGLTEEENSLYHALEMLNYFSKVDKKHAPSFIRFIPEDDIDSYIDYFAKRFLNASGDL